MFVVSAYAASEGEVTHTETGVANEAEHGGTFPPFDSATFPSQLLWLAITFGLFYLFLKRVALPRISDILEYRRDRIAQDLDQAARMKREADEAIAAYEQGLAEGRARAGQIGQEARDEAKAEADAERREVESELDRKLADAEARIRTIKGGAMKEVGAIAEETATTIVESLIGARVSKVEAANAVKAVRG
jgi:F-type H+-transporting ATPase subunit b